MSKGEPVLKKRWRTPLNTLLIVGVLIAPALILGPISSSFTRRELGGALENLTSEQRATLIARAEPLGNQIAQVVSFRGHSLIWADQRECTLSRVPQLESRGTFRVTSWQALRIVPEERNWPQPLPPGQCPKKITLMSAESAAREVTLKVSATGQFTGDELKLLPTIIAARLNERAQALFEGPQGEHSRLCVMNPQTCESQTREASHE